MGDKIHDCIDDYFDGLDRLEKSLNHYQPENSSSEFVYLRSDLQKEVPKLLQEELYKKLVAVVYGCKNCSCKKDGVK